MNYTKKRYITYLAITIFTFVLPFITINGNHMLMLSFVNLQFHFLGYSYNMNELYVMPFLLMFLFIGIFAMTTMFGRVWCGWACPQTIFRVIYRDLIEGTILDLRKIKNKQKEPNLTNKINAIKKYIGFLLLAIICLVISVNFIWYFVPPEDFFAYMKEPKEHLFLIGFVLTTAGFLLFDIVFMKEDFCTYVCPYSRIQSVLYDDDTKQVVYNTTRGGNVYQHGQKNITNIKQWSSNEECTACEACVKVCPTHIDIRKGLQVECINCLECSDACANVMGKLGKSSLIYWGSTNSVIKNISTKLLNGRNIMYIVALVVSLVLAGVFASQKESLLVNINRTTQLYAFVGDGLVKNDYIVTIQNTTNKAYNFDVELEDKENYEVKRFQTLALGSGQRQKTVLIIQTKQPIKITDKKDTPVELNMTFLAKENPEIRLPQTTIFIHPRSDLF